MSSETDIRISFEPSVAVNAQFVQELNAILDTVGFVRIPRRDGEPDTMLGGDVLVLGYEPCGGSGSEGDFICLSLKFATDGMLERISIDSNMKSDFRVYSPAERELAEKIQSVAIQIHKQYKAVETKAIRESFFDDPWFLFSDQIWEPIPCLPAEEDRYEFKLRFTKAYRADSAFYQRLDGCMTGAAYRLWRAYRFDRSADAWRVDCGSLPFGHVGDSGVELVYRHSEYNDGFIAVNLRFQKDTILTEGVALDIFLSPEGQTDSKAAETLNKLSDCLRQTFRGEYWSVRESRYLWKT